MKKEELLEKVYAEIAKLVKDGLYNDETRIDDVKSLLEIVEKLK